MLSNPGIWVRNLATCPFAGTVRSPVRPVEVPFSRVNSKLTVAAVDPAFTIATPVCAEPTCWVLKKPDASAYNLKAAPARIAGTPASETVMLLFLKEKMPRPTGVLLPAAGVSLTEPDCTTAAVPDVLSVREVRGGMVYGKLVAVCPAILTACENSTEPVIAVSPGFTNTICVAHPPPSA